MHIGDPLHSHTQHPDADVLYIEKINVGEKGTHTLLVSCLTSPTAHHSDTFPSLSLSLLPPPSLLLPLPPPPSLHLLLPIGTGAAIQPAGH